MFRRTLIAAVAASVATTVAAQAQFGTAAEARAMFDKAVAAVRADKARRWRPSTPGDGFEDRDLYPFCATPRTGCSPPILPCAARR